MFLGLLQPLLVICYANAYGIGLNDTSGFDDSRNSSRQPLKSSASNNEQLLRSQFLDSQRGLDTTTNTNGYDVSGCEQYNHQPGSNPTSFAIHKLRNNRANGNNIFKGSFIVDPEKYSTVWISFKPVEEYAKGEEYQVVFYPEFVSIGTIGTSKTHMNFPEKLQSWISTEIYVRADGLVEVLIDGVQEQLRYTMDEIVRNRPYFIELKGPNSDTEPFTAFFDCWSFESKG